MIIKINNKKYIGQCNALSYMFYKRIFNANVFEDLEHLKTTLIIISNQKQADKDIIMFYQIISRFIYTLIYTKNQCIEDFETWNKKIEIKEFTDELVNTVIETFLNSFIDEEVIKELEKQPKTTSKESVFPEHNFIRTCIENNITMEDLKILTYSDVMKIFLSNNTHKNKGFREATQSDWDRLASM